jgi:hypothetical protein
MLLSKPITPGTVITVKLTSGEELLARYDSHTDTELVVTKPSSLSVSANGLGTMPWMISSPGSKVCLNRQCVIAYAAADDEIGKSYQEATSEIKLV